MALLFLSNHTTGRTGMRTVNTRTVLLVLAATGLLLCAGGFLAGLFAGKVTASTDATQAAQSDPVREKFSVDQLGQISARLMRLESDAQGLVRKLGMLDAIESKIRQVRQRTGQSGSVTGSQSKTHDAEGGPLLPAQSCVRKNADGQSLAQATTFMSCLQGKLSLMEQATEERSLMLMTIPARIPVDHPDTSSPFGNRIDPINHHVAFHSGLDFRAPTGTPIYAAAGGTVRYAGYMNGMGNMVEIDHGNGMVTRYGHTSRLLVKTGDLVTPRGLIAEVGSTGRSTGPHLHFEILQDGRYIDPEFYLALAQDIAAL